jgi:hypothetical protein
VAVAVDSQQASHRVSWSIPDYMFGRPGRGSLRLVNAHLGNPVLGMTEAAVKKAAQRLRQRYREILRGRIGGTVADPGQVDDELRALFAILSS